MIYRPGETGSLELEPPRDDLADLPALVAEIVETMRRGNVAELEIVRGDFRIALRSFPPTRAATSPGANSGIAEATLDEQSEIAPANVHVITAPMIGTFYSAPAPGEPPFVQPGDEIEEGQVIGIVEAMKIMNEIAADRAGTVLEIVADNGQTVEYGSPLVRIQLPA